jgi:subtilisin family serine protease
MALLKKANGLYESGLVRYAHPDFYAKTVERTLPNQPHTPDDPMFTDQWHLNNTGQGDGVVDADINAPEAWDFTLGNNDVRIAVIDDAIDIGHEDLSPNVIPGTARDTENEDNDPSPEADGDEHGTCVAGLAVARGDNATGVSGSCPRCGLIAIRATGGSYTDEAEAFDHAVDQDAWIITNSWGYDVGTPVTDDVVDAIENAATTGRDGLGAVVLFAMTNSEVDNCVAPTPDISALDSVIAVSRATNEDDLGNGGYGDCMDLLGPTRGGTLGLTTTDWTGADGYTTTAYHDNFGGTSGATPVVAGTAGLLLSLNPDLSRAQVQRILEETADKIDAADADYDDSGFSDTHGYGRINAHHALVPTVRIRAPETVTVGVPFSITVTGTAPYGLRFIWWWGDGTGIVDLDKAHMVGAGNEPVYTFTWTGITINTPGIYTFGANARDNRYPTPGDGYPHQASEGGGISYTTVSVVDDRMFKRPSRRPFPEPLEMPKKRK